MTTSEEIKRRLERQAQIKVEARRLNLEEKTNDKILKLLQAQAEEEKETIEPKCPDPKCNYTGECQESFLKGGVCKTPGWMIDPNNRESIIPIESSVTELLDIAKGGLK